MSNEIEPGQIWKHVETEDIIYVEGCDEEYVEAINLKKDRMDSYCRTVENILENCRLVADENNSGDLIKQFREILCQME